MMIRCIMHKLCYYGPSVIASIFIYSYFFNSFSHSVCLVCGIDLKSQLASPPADRIYLFSSTSSSPNTHLFHGGGYLCDSIWNGHSVKKTICETTTMTNLTILIKRSKTNRRIKSKQKNGEKK